MPIEVHCDCCDSKILVREEYAGRTGSCRRCGSSITIPRAENTLDTRLLSRASAEEMVRELKRRRQRAVLLLLDGDDPKSMSGDQLDGKQASLRAVGADGFDQSQLADIYRHLAAAAQKRHEAQQATEKQAESDVFDLKGDELGMSLADFKKKHFRRVASVGKVAPYCSDEYPGQPINDLLADPWHHAAGIIHARIDLPEENNSPTIAGMPTELVLYQFLDGRLFQISAFFPPEVFHTVKAALVSKFGEPVSDKPAPRCLEWWTMESKISLRQGTLRPPQPTALTYCHDALMREAIKRKPDNAADL